MMELKASDDRLLYMAAFYCDGDFSEESEPLFVSYTGFPYWLWPGMREEWHEFCHTVCTGRVGQRG